MLAAISRSPMRTARSSRVTMPVELVAVDDRQAAHAVVDHELGRLGDVHPGCAGDHRARGVAAGRRVAGVAVGQHADREVAVGDEADREPGVVDQHHRADVALAHQFGDVAHRGVGRRGDHRLGHDLADLHESGRKTTSAGRPVRCGERAGGIRPPIATYNPRPWHRPHPPSSPGAGASRPACASTAPFLDLVLAVGRSVVARGRSRRARSGGPGASVSALPVQRRVGPGRSA